MHMFSDVRFGLLLGGRNENTETLLHEYLSGSMRNLLQFSLLRQ
jgi:hypothetical protein